MTLPLLLCALLVAASGLHFGRRFAAAHRAGHLPLVPVLAHAAVSVTAVSLSTLLDPTPGTLLWLVVAGASLAGLIAGTLLPTRVAVPALAPVPEVLPTA